MKRVAKSRRHHLGVLRRRPPLDPMPGTSVRTVEVRKVDEVRQLLHLVDRGLLSEEEFERQAAKIYAAPP